MQLNCHFIYILQHPDKAKLQMKDQFTYDLYR